MKKKIIFVIGLIILIGILLVRVFFTEKSYVGKITRSDLQTISSEIEKGIPKKYMLNGGACYHKTSKIRLQFDNFKEWEIRFEIKRICIKSEKIKAILEKYQIKRKDILDLFILHEGGPATLD